ncbi:AAA family ATPase [Bacillus nakamurai]|uniref:AAA family ATPase n=1 Tax=Bacillus nakamurai TaxID=1793963 RepID=UPI0020C4DBCB|nr:AAA family ATPase [Bacillus nakamurai]MCP6682142.1 ATP-binding protein [Bacillus nakamurai]
MITKLEITLFRKYKNQEIHFGKRLNLICGLNGTGKSSILAMLGHTIELKLKDGKTVTNKQFRTEFGEIFKLSEKYDYTEDQEKKYRYKVFTKINEVEDSRSFTLTKQTQKRKSSNDETKQFSRIRPIPRGTIKGGKSTSAKIKYPVLYLGLSRLYPIGEIPEDVEIKNDSIKLEQSELNWIKDHKRRILGTIDKEVLDIQTYQAGTKDSKISGVGINTELYDFTANSVGQDNILQILISLLSFKRLKENYTEYSGGILLIDELEASLFPHAQESLLKLLDELSKELNLQIIFTSHSSIVIDYMWKKYSTNSRDFSNPKNLYNIVFLDYKDSQVIVNNDFDVSSINAKLNFKLNYSNFTKESNMVIYTEDDTAKWFLEQFINSFSEIYILDSKFQKLKSKIRPLNLSNNQLMNLVDGDEYFRNKVVIVVDGDTVIPEEKQNYNNIISLPGSNYPEKLIIDFLKSNESDKYFNTEECYERNFSRDVFNSDLERTATTLKLNGKNPTEKEINKNWFFNNYSFLEDTSFIKYWIIANPQESEKLTRMLINSHNCISKYTLSEFITDSFKQNQMAIETDLIYN